MLCLVGKSDACVWIVQAYLKSTRPVMEAVAGSLVYATGTHVKRVIQSFQCLARNAFCRIYPRWNLSGLTNVAKPNDRKSELR